MVALPEEGRSYIGKVTVGGWKQPGQMVLFARGLVRCLCCSRLWEYEGEQEIISETACKVLWSCSQGWPTKAT